MPGRQIQWDDTPRETVHEHVKQMAQPFTTKDKRHASQVRHNGRKLLHYEITAMESISEDV